MMYLNRHVRILISTSKKEGKIYNTLENKNLKMKFRECGQ